MKIHIGTSGYAYREWKGIFYPEKISPKEMLRFYAERLGAVEINNTFYRMPTEALLLSWAEQVPEDFVFAVKAPQVITHLKRLRNVAEETDHLFRTLTVLGPKLGPVLFQFPASFRVDRTVLGDFLDRVPRTFACAFDFRSPSWVEPETLGRLREKGFGLCIEDTDESPAAEIVSTAAWGYLRLRRSDYGDADLSEWLRRVSAQNWDRAFVFFKHEDEAKGPGAAMRFRKIAGRPAKETR